MGLFDSVSFSATTTLGGVGLVNGKPTFSLAAAGGSTPPAPTPLTRAVPTPAQSGLMGWIRTNRMTAIGLAIAAAVGLILVIRR